MESEEALRYYLDEVKDTQNDIHHIDEEIHIPNGKNIFMFYNYLLSIVFMILSSIFSRDIVMCNTHSLLICFRTVLRVVQI